MGELTIGRVAAEAGLRASAIRYTIAEVKRLLSGFSRRTPPGKRWRLMAEAKVGELDRRLAQIHRMKQVLAEKIAVRLSDPRGMRPRHSERALARPESTHRDALVILVT